MRILWFKTPPVVPLGKGDIFPASDNSLLSKEGRGEVLK